MTRTLGLGLAGAGRFGAFLAAAVADLPGLQVQAVADPDQARATELRGRARRHGDHDAGRTCSPTTGSTSWPSSPRRTGTPRSPSPRWPPAGTSSAEKPLATTVADAREVAAAAAASGRQLWSTTCCATTRCSRRWSPCRTELLGPVQRFAFENDASDEDLAPGPLVLGRGDSGGIFVEHGVHFFDAAHLLLGTEPVAVSATAAHRADGTTDLVSATALHPGGVLATHTHGFSHADRCERQALRLDHGTAEVRVEGWIPLRARVEAWTDDAGAETAYGLPGRAAALFEVPGHRLGPGSGITAVVHRDAGPPAARGRGRDLVLPHRVVLELVLGDDGAKARVYAESVRAAVADLLSAAAGGPPVRSGPAQALAATTVADAARRSAAEGRQVRPALTGPDRTSPTTDHVRTA